jgi:hypothetical protein
MKTHWSSHPPWKPRRRHVRRPTFEPHASVPCLSPCTACIAWQMATAGWSGGTPTDVCRSIDSLSVWPLPSDPVLFWAPLFALCQMIEIRIYCHGSLAVAGTGPTPTHACMRACAVAAGHGDYSTRRHESSDLTQVPNQSNPIPSRPAGDLCRRTSTSDHGVRGHCLQLLRNLSVAHLSPSNMTTNTVRISGHSLRSGAYCLFLASTKW